jgi:hypothetical protein
MRAEASLLEKLRETSPGSFRHSVLDAARRFKAGWVDLGKLLVEVRDRALYTEWGFATFDQYCSKELHIRKSTAEKLVRSFSFLSRHEPKAVANDDIVRTAPPFEVVEVLAGAEERGQLDADRYRAIRQSIWDSEKPVAELRREFSERFPRPPPEPRGEDAQLSRLAHLARKLAADLKSSRGVPAAVAERAAALAEDVEELASQARKG